MEQEETTKVDLSSLGSFDFTPAWAKKDAGVTVGKVRPMREDRAPRSKDNTRGPRGPRPMDGNRPPRKESQPRKEFSPRSERPRPLEAEVKILPDPKALGTIIRKLQNDCHAYKLKDLAYFFLDNPSSVLLKVTPRVKDAASEPMPFFQCKACGYAALSKDDLEEHILNAHLADYYETREIEVEPPKGNFNCVAKCGLSGVLLGPPNIHEFNAVVKEMIRTKYPEMSEAQYRSHIEMVREADAIEDWRKSATKRLVFAPKGDAETVLTREQAEGEFRRTMLPSLIEEPKHLMITAEVALNSPLKPLVWLVKDALEQERRAPYNMCFALRGAFHHRKLNFFRVNDARGQEFVTSAELKSFDAAHAIPELARVAKFVEEHPCASRSEIVTEPEIEKHLTWLISTGHIVAFTNGVYSAVEKYPKYGPQWRKKAEKTPGGGEAKPAEVETEVKEEVKDESTVKLAE